MATKDLTFRLFGEDSTATRSLQNLSTEAGKTAKHFEGAFKLAGAAIAGAGLAAVAGIAAIVKTGIGEAMDASAGMAQLQAGIKSTGGAANVTVGHMEDLASSIQNMSGQTDDSVVKAEQLLLTFTNIRNKGPDKIFDQATSAAADMAAKMGGDASTNAIRLGKALNDPVKGLTALSKVGVSFTEGQKKQVEAMVKTGNTVGAQKIILGELNKEFGGAAKAAGQSLPGQLQRIQRAFEDVSQTVVETILPVVTPALGKLLDAVKKSTPVLQAMARTVATTLKNAFTTIGPVLSGFGHVLTGQILPAIASFGTWMSRNRGLVLFLAQAIGLAVIGFKTYVVTMQIIRTATAAWAAVQGLLNGTMALNPVGAIVIAIIALIAVVVLLVTHWKQVCAFLQNVWGAVCKWFGDTLNSVGQWWSDTWNSIVAVTHVVWGAIVGAVKSKIGQVRSTVTGVITSIKNFFAGAGSWLVTAGRNVLEGLVNGITGAIGNVIGTVRNVASNVMNTFKGILGIRSPSKVFHDFGTNIGQGLNNGILGTVNQVAAASNKLADTVIGMFEQKKGGISAKAKEAALETIKSGTKTLEAEAKKRASLATQIKNASKKLTTDLAEQKKGDANLKSGTIDSGNVTGFGSSGDMLGNLRGLVGKTTRFKTDLQTLVRRGLDSTTFRQLVDAGVTGGGLAAADELLANPSDMTQIVALQKQLGTAAGSLASYAGQREYAPTITADRKKVALLKGEDKIEAWKMQKTASTMVNKVARETHVHVHLSGHYAGSKDDLAKTVMTAFRDAVKRGQIPKNAFSSL